MSRLPGTAVADGQCWRVSVQHGVAVIEVWSVEAQAWLVSPEGDWSSFDEVGALVAGADAEVENAQRIAYNKYRGSRE